MSQVLRVTAKTFKSAVLESSIPVLVDLYATWCMPCKVMGQMLDRLAPELEGRAKVVKIDTDQEPDIAAAFGVSSIPTLVLMHKGKAVDGAVGIVSPDKIRQMIRKVSPVTSKAAVDRIH